MLGKIAWKNIVHKPLNTTLCIGLLTFGVGIITLLLLIQHTLEQKFEQDLQNIDLVVGAKGSPLQLVLSAIYHLDTPPGNIQLEDARKLMENPNVLQAIPLAYGDSYQGFRLLGTTKDYVEKYEANLQKGHIFSENMEVTLGASVAEQTQLKVGDTFIGTHGEVKGGLAHNDHPFRIVGILEKTNTVLDQLLLTNIESVWEVHIPHGEDIPHVDSLYATELQFTHQHNHGEDHNHDHEDPSITVGNMEITAILLKYKDKKSVLTMPQVINEQTNMQAVLPAFEINRLFYMLGLGGTTLRLIAGGIILMAGFSVFFVLYSRLRDRKYELALMRSVGYEPKHLFALLVFEGLILSALGYVLGWLLSRAGLYFINKLTENDFNLNFGNGTVPGEGWLALLTFGVGVLAALLPAWQAMRMNVSATLSEN